MRGPNKSTLVLSGFNFPEPDTSYFYYKCGDWSFSVQQQNHLRKSYWYGFKRINGRLFKLYICPVGKLTPHLLYLKSSDFMAVAVSQMTSEEFKIWDENEFAKGPAVVEDPVEVAEIGAWLDEFESEAVNA